MSVGFHKFTSNDPCSICWQSMEGEYVVAHDGPNGEDHPWHRTCIEDWLNIDNKCPQRCHITLDKDAKLFWSDRSFKELFIKAAEPIQEDLQKLLKIGMTLGAGIGLKCITNDPLGVATLLIPVGLVALGGGVVAMTEGAVIGTKVYCQSLYIENLNNTASDDDSFEELPLI
ncbi:MAG TPA: hypothetical protein VGP47_01365 [Parachlamydiaceae bacterium]|nr:hypothetical protein [Parachlamydiaceae bacterium]